MSPAFSWVCSSPFPKPDKLQRLSDSSVLKLRTLFRLWMTDQFRLLILLFKKAQLVDIL